MIKIGNINKVKIIRKSDIAYIAQTEEKDELFIHYKEAKDILEVDQEVDVFVYYDKQKRICATTMNPLITTTKADFASVIGINNFGVFMNIGISKDFLLSEDYLPYDKTLWPKIDDKICVILKIKKDSLIAKPLNKEEMKLIDDPSIVYTENQVVKGYIHRLGDQGTNCVSVDKKDIFIYFRNQREKERIGKLVEITILAKTEQNNYSGSLIKQKEFMIEDDKDYIFKVLCDKYDGKMPFTSENDSESILKEFNMSRKAFKRALGNLYKNHLIYFDEENNFTIKI